MKVIKLVLFVMVIGMMACKSTKYNDLDDGLYADLQTDRGDILLKLEYEVVPITVSNFVSLAEGTNPYVDDSFKEKKFYDGLKFHRIVPDFIVQGGDFRGNGTGDPGYKFEDEFTMNESGNLELSHDGPGILSMANSGPDSNGSQFFITHKETKFLDGVHTVFGHVVFGQEVVDSMKQNDVIQKVEIIRIGKEAKSFDAAAEFSAYFEHIEEKQKLAQEQKEKQKEELVQFVKDNEANAVVLPSGLKIISIKEGTGVKPVIGTNINVYYAGFFTTGDVFDTNVKEIAEVTGKYDRRRDQMGGYKPMGMEYSRDAAMIAGFKEGILNMNYGDKVLLIVPSHLAYGEQGSRGVIPPNADLWFQLEIVE